MKKNRKLSLTLAAALALTALTACGSLSASAAISRDDVARIAAEHLGRDVSELTILERDYDRDDNKYEIELVVDGYEYDFEISASTGRVLEVDRERVKTRRSDRGSRRHDDDWDDRYDDDWDDRYDDDWDDRYEDRWEDDDWWDDWD